MLNLSSLSPQSLHYLASTQQTQGLQEQANFMQQQAIPEYLATMLQPQQERNQSSHQPQHQTPPLHKSQQPQLPHIQALSHPQEQEQQLEVQKTAVQPLTDSQPKQSTQPQHLQAQLSYLQKSHPLQTEASQPDQLVAMQNFLPLPPQLEPKQGETFAPVLLSQVTPPAEHTVPSRPPEELAVLLQAFKDDNK